MLRSSGWIFHPLFLYERYVIFMYVLTADEATEYLKEIVSSDRIVRLQGNVYVLKHPTYAQQRDADKLQAVVTNTLLKDPTVLTKSQARKILVERLEAMGKNESYLEKQQQIQVKLAKILADSTDEKQAKEAVTSSDKMLSLINSAINQLPEDELAVIQDMQEIEELQVRLYSGTVEHIASTEKDLYLLSMCVYNEKGNLVWGIGQDGTNLVTEETNIELVNELQQEFIKFLTGLPTPIQVTISYEDVEDKLKKE